MFFSTKKSKSKASSRLSSVQSQNRREDGLGASSGSSSSELARIAAGGSPESQPTPAGPPAIIPTPTPVLPSKSSPERPTSSRPTNQSEWSTPIVPNGLWCSQNFVTGAGMVLFQHETKKVVIIWDSKNEYWLLPKGRKDIGETIESCALREAYEESGYRAQFLPLKIPTRAPAPPEDKDARKRLNTEPIFMQMTSWGGIPGFMPKGAVAGEYLTLWYVGEIPEDAVREENTGMPDELHFVSHLVTVEEARERLHPSQSVIVDYAWAVYAHTLAELESESKRASGN